MTKRDFLSTEKLEKNITNRKVFINKDKVTWLQTKHIEIMKEHLHSIYMQCFEQDVQELNIGKKIRGKLLPLNAELLVPLWPDGKPIHQAKLNDLQSMRHLIPEDCWPFYEGLKGIRDSSDEDIDGFGPELDFDMEEAF